MKNGIKPLIIVIVILAVAAIAFMTLRHATKLPKKVTINTQNQPTTGNPKATLHFVIFEDLKCHNCMRYNLEIYPQIKKKYINTRKAKYTVINVAFIQGSMPAANAARCVYAQNKKRFFPYVKAIYKNQLPENQNWATIPKLMSLAKNIPGINKKKLSQCIYKSPYTNFINNNLKLGMKAMDGIVATPTLYINGYLVKPMTMHRIGQIIDALNE